MAKILGREKSCLQVCHFIVGIGVGAGTEYERPDWLISASPPLKRKTTFTKQIRKKSMKTKVKNSYDDCPYNMIYIYYGPFWSIFSRFSSVLSTRLLLS